MSPVDGTALPSDLQIGKAAEYLVCADLILKGYIAFPSEQGLSFDIVLLAGHRLLKVQVKSTRKPIPIPQRRSRQTEKYCFNVRRCGKGGRCQYGEKDVDIFALVAMDTRTIGYLKASEIRQTMFFLPEYAEPIPLTRGMISKARRLSTYSLVDCL